ncbi:hypothetical protein [Adlercreutzia sp. ZJ138]|uniref:hypothetical protein n=1 Tax=Adlercreutzia sp. ZJ138 TaxID=2709405 RepID=UPI0013ED460E|nr:hypothetical protein [Adlercreutzia sp. ZJ138]
MKLAKNSRNARFFKVSRVFRNFFYEMYDVVESVKLVESSGKTAIASDQGKRKSSLKKRRAVTVSFPFLPLQIVHFVKKVPEATANFAQSRISRKKLQKARFSLSLADPWISNRSYIPIVLIT